MKNPRISPENLAPKIPWIYRGPFSVRVNQPHRGAKTLEAKRFGPRFENGRLVHLTYGTSGGTSDVMNRVEAINDDNAGSPGSALAEYTYLGGATVVARYEYDGLARRIKKHVDSDSPASPSGIDTYVHVFRKRVASRLGW